MRLALLLPLCGIAVERLSEDIEEGTDQAVIEIADATFFYGEGASFEKAAKIVVARFKYSISRASVGLRFADIRKTVKKFRISEASFIEKYGEQPAWQKFRYAITTNRPISLDLAEALAAASERFDMHVGKAAHNEIRLAGAAMPGPEQQAPPSPVKAVARSGVAGHGFSNGKNPAGAGCRFMSSGSAQVSGPAFVIGATCGVFRRSAGCGILPVRSGDCFFCNFGGPVRRLQILEDTPMRSRLLAILPAVLLLWSASALAENRIALVVGNSTYKSVTILPNPANDAKAVADMLRSAQFEVIEEPDLSQTALRRAIREFANKAAQKGPDTISLVYYAGHGIQVDGENYLVPVDADIQRESDVPIEAVRLNDLMTALGSTPSKTRIVILDACRNNPFSEINKITGRGLAIVDAPTGSMVSYSTSPGMQAADGQGANSPFTAALIAVAREPNVPVEQAFKRIRVAVHKTTDGLQTPWESSSLTSDFAFFGPTTGGQKDGSKDAQKTAAPAGVLKTVDVWRKELAPKSESDAFEIVIRADDVEAYEAFLTVFPSASVASRVRGLLDRRREMTTWYMAVLVNTPLSYQGFLDRYPHSDLAPTAQRLRDRAQLRAQSAMARATPPGGPNSPDNPIATPVSLPVAPACICTPAKPTKEKSKPSKPTRSAVSHEPVVVVQQPPPVSIGIGIGGLGGIGRSGMGHSRDYGPSTHTVPSSPSSPSSLGRRQY